MENCAKKINHLSFTQCISCSSNNAICQLAMIQDAVVINHAPLGSAGDFSDYNFTNRVGLKSRNLLMKNARLISTNLEEREMVYGGVDKLTETINDLNWLIH